MNPCNSLITFSGSIYNHSVTNVKIKDLKKKKKKTNCLTAANTSHKNYKEGIFKLLNLCGRKRAKSDAYKYIHCFLEKQIVRTFAIMASHTETIGKQVK